MTSPLGPSAGFFKRSVYKGHVRSPRVGHGIVHVARRIKVTRIRASLKKKKEHLTDLTLVESSQHVFFKHTFCCCKKKSDEFHLSTSQSNFFPWFLKINLSQKSHKKSTSSNAGFFWGSDSPLHGGPLEFIITSKSSQGYG